MNAGRGLMRNERNHFRIKCFLLHPGPCLGFHLITASTAASLTHTPTGTIHHSHPPPAAITERRTERERSPVFPIEGNQQPSPRPRPFSFFQSFLVFSEYPFFCSLPLLFTWFCWPPSVRLAADPCSRDRPSARAPPPATHLASSASCSG